MDRLHEADVVEHRLLVLGHRVRHERGRADARLYRVEQRKPAEDPDSELTLLLGERGPALDVVRQRHLLDLLGLLRSLGTTCVIALHDLDHAAVFCDSIAILDRGQLVL